MAQRHDAGRCGRFASAIARLAACLRIDVSKSVRKGVSTLSFAAVLITAGIAACQPAWAAIPSSERAFLQSLYSATNGNGWINRSNWNGPPGSECTWYGVNCDVAGTSVAWIALNGNGLTGTLPPSLAALSKLEEFHIADNQIGGTLPAIAGMANLKGVFFENNRFTGSIPSLLNLPLLSFFYAHTNELTGTIPQLSQLTSLAFIQIHNNRLTGTVPDAPPNLFEGSSFLCPNPLTVTANAAWDRATPGPLWSTNCATIPAVERAALLAIFNSAGGSGWVNPSGWGGGAGGECAWYGVYCNAAKTNVVRLQLDNNNLTGGLPAAISQLSFLQSIDISNNAMTGSIPPLSALTRLERVIATGNQLSGSIPALTGLGALRDFRVSNNQLTGSLPAISSLPGLQYFHADGNLLSGSMPALAGASALIEFAVHRNALSGPLPAIASLPQLQRFRVEDNQLSGPVPDAAPALVAEGSALCPNAFDYSPGDTAKNAAWNSATPGDAWQYLCIAIPAAEREALMDLYFATNFTEGGVNWNLRTNWTGPVGTECTWIGVTCDAQQRHVTALNFNTNNLIGNLPASIVNLTRLTSLMLPGNRLRGPLPPIAGMQHLTRIILSANEFTGPIPPLTNLPVLADLVLNQNQLTGPLPSLAGLPALKTISVNDNQLSGALPPAPATLLAGASRLCGNQFTIAANAAWDAATIGDTPWSEGCIAPRLAQSLALQPLSLLMMGQTATVVAAGTPATGPSMPVRFASTTPLVCSINPGTGVLSVVAGLLPGTLCTITADRPGDSAFNAAPQATVSAAVITSCRLDANDDRRLDAGIDGLLLLRYLAGVRGNALVSGLTPLTGNRTTPAAIESFFAAQNFSSTGSTTTPRATRDGVAIYRHLQGAAASAMIAGTGIDAALSADVKSRVTQWCFR